ncbi:MAG: hypothetical protein AAFQ32_09825 [Pseudomonadota bacterium]
MSWASEIDVNASVWLPLIFSCVGGLTSLLLRPAFARFDQRLALSGRAWERIQDHRLEAYEALLQVADSLQTTVPTGQHDSGLVETKPICLRSIDDFVLWYDQVLQQINSTHNWVDRQTSQKLLFLRDYLQNLKIAVAQTDAKDLEKFAVYTKADQIDLSIEIREAAQSFFRKIDKRDLSYRGNGKYSFAITQKRLGETKLVEWMEKNDLLWKEDQPTPEITS